MKDKKTNKGMHTVNVLACTNTRTLSNVTFALSGLIHWHLKELHEDFLTIIETQM